MSLTFAEAPAARNGAARRVEVRETAPSARQESRDVRGVGRERLAFGSRNGRERLADRDLAASQAPRRDGPCARVRERPEVRLGRVAARIAVEERLARA